MTLQSVISDIFTRSPASVPIIKLEMFFAYMVYRKGLTRERIYASVKKEVKKLTHEQFEEFLQRMLEKD